MATEHPMDRTLRWMSENLAGAQRAVHLPGHEDAGKPCTNSGTGIIVCCYINALGKVLLKGQGKDHQRFKGFVTQCMQPFLQAGSTKALPPPTKTKKPGGEEWLYHVYRCGFIHGFYPGNARWRRSANSRYWTQRGGVTLNIDALVRAFFDGVEVFRQKAKDDPDLRTNFGKYITK